MKRVAVMLTFGAAVTLAIVVFFIHKRTSRPHEVANVAFQNRTSPTPNLLNSVTAGTQQSNNPTIKQSTGSLQQSSATVGQPIHPSNPSNNPLIASPAPPPAFVAFSDWADKFLSRSAPASVPQGEALAWKRREEMLNLIQSDPQRAIALAAPFAWHTALPTNITRHIEQWVDGRGALNVLVATDFERNKNTVSRTVDLSGKSYDAFVYGRRSAQVSQTAIPLHGIALAGKMAVYADSVRSLEVAEAESLANQRGEAVEKICGVSGQPADYRGSLVAAEVGGEVRYLCGKDHLRLLNEQSASAESGTKAVRAATLSNDKWTHGVKTLLYIRANFPDNLTEPISEAEAYDAMDGVNAFYAEQSYDLTSLTTMVTPLVTLPQTKAWYSTAGTGQLLTDAREAARLAGFNTVNYDRDIVAFTSVPGYDFGGLAFVHGKGVWLQSTGVGVTSHELGHNYGLWHANSWDVGFTASVIGPGTNSEYGNVFDTMGRASAGNNQFNATHKNVLDWIPDQAVHQVVSNGVYRVYAFDTPARQEGRFYAAKVRKDFRRDYWLEYRQKFKTNPWLQNGFLLNWAPWPESNGGTSLLDTTPGTPTNDESKRDAAITVGRTFSDESAGVHLTTLARGITGTNEWLDLQVNLGLFPTNQPPTLQIEIDQTNGVAVGALVHFHATASDPNGDPLAYSWSFDDFTFSTNNLPWTARSWTNPGDYVVRCVVSDMKGGVASANGVVRVGAPSSYRIAGRVTDTNGVPIEGVRVDNSGTDLASWWGGYTDSDGRYVIAGVTTDLSLNATKYGFSFAPGSWSNPLAVTTNLTGIDFVATPMPSVHISVTTNSILENNPEIQVFTLTRNGDTNADLAVNLNLSGSATAGSDFTLTPTLNDGTNYVVIPAGTNSVTFTFQAVNDGTVEGPQTATLTVLEDPAYVLAPLAEATITITDDDSPAQPAVSVSALTPTVPENSMDRGQFRFTRTGSTQGDLQVVYSASGTATPGTDYTTLLGVVVIPAGSSSTIAEFRTIDDKIVEPDETVVVTINPDPAYSVSGSSATATILDDDLLTVTISPTVSNAAEPSTPGRFTVKRDGDLTANLVVGYTVSGTATSGLDYTSLAGTITTPAGQPSADIVLTPLDDNLLEGDESVILTLTNAPEYDVGTPGSATLFIRDRQKVTVSIVAEDDTASEPGADTGLFTISRGAVVNGDLTVNFAISGTALNGIDYVPLDNSVVIPDGQSSVSLEIIPFDDLQIEYAEDVILTLLPSTNYNIDSAKQARVVILDEDASSIPAVGFTFTSSSAPENKSPGISVSLSATSSVPISVDYRVIGGTASSNEYTLAPSPLTFQPGEFAKSIDLTVNNNTTAQSNRTIRLVMFNPVNATLDGNKLHTYTILDDDTNAISVSATAPSASETALVAGNFRISRTGFTNAALPILFQVTGTASAPSDYAPLGTTAIIPAGANFVDLPVIPTDDRTTELNQTVVLTLISAPASRLTSPTSATVVIGDNDVDTLPVVSVSSAAHPYAVEGGANGEFVFTRSATNGPLTVSLTIGGTASNGADYNTIPNTVSFADGQDTVSVPVLAVNDTQVEGDETVVVSITLKDTYRISYPSAATVTIQDNDQRVRLDASDFTASEPGLDTGEFTFTRFGTTNTPLQVFFTISGTASNGVDYVAISNSFVIPAGQLSAALPIIPIDDNLVEGDETLTLTLLPDAAYSTGVSLTGTVVIHDDEPMLTITATVPDVVEGSQQPGVFKLARTGDPHYDLVAHLAIGGTATYGVDYPPFATNVYFSCGVMAIDLQVFPTNELVVEGIEIVTAQILPDPAYTILYPSNAVITIEDAATNPGPVVTITSPTANTVFLRATNVGIIVEANVTDDSSNAPPTLSWTQISGPDSVLFGSTNMANTTAYFTNAGVYTLRLTAEDGQLQNYADLQVVVDAVDLLATNLLHWTLDDGAGTNALDSSGAGRNGVLTGSPNWTSNGILGGALRLVGTNDCVRLSTNSGFLEGLNAFSLSLWINSASTNTEYGIFTSSESGTNATLSLATRTYASCGHSTNVLEATVATTAGAVRRISISDALASGWQHLVLAWSSGLAPALFINGRLDQPLSQMFPLGGVLTNCSQFIVGKGPPGTPNSWNGLVDDVRVFPRALTANEIAALAALPPTNYGPVVNAGADVTLQLTVPGVLEGTVTDDGLPNPPGAVSNNWSMVSGPAPITLTNAAALTNTILFAQAGDYVFRLMSDDGQVKVFDDVTLSIIEPTRIDLFTTDGEAAELGPDTGEFTLTRNGATNELTVYLAISGTASNGVDYVQLTNAIIFPAGTDTVAVLVTPFLDDRTEGDETLTLTIITNLSYSIGNPTATVTIHDSPYGMWNIAHFTLEELTDPKLSGDGADYDHDRWINFVEYAVNTDPKIYDTNAPLVTAIELNPADGKNHITFTYHRRLQPTDVAYAPYVSNDLVTWNTGTNYIEEISAIADPNQITETVKSRVVAPYTPTTIQFVTVRVWLLVTKP